MRITAPDSLQGADSARLYGGTRRKVSAQVRQEKETTMETAEKVSPSKWAQENLSGPRARAFWKAYRELENKKLSADWRTESQKCDQIVQAFEIKVQEQVDAIEEKGYTEAAEIEKQGRELIRKAQELREKTRHDTITIRIGVYQTDEYKAQQAKASALWHRDDAVFQPKVLALMDKYLKAQEASK